MTYKVTHLVYCDNLPDCIDYCAGATEDHVRQLASAKGWTKTPDGKDFCRSCASLRSEAVAPK